MLTAIIALCRALEAIFAFLATTEGQIACEEYRANRDQVHAAILTWWTRAKVDVEKLPSWWERIFK